MLSICYAVKNRTNLDSEYGSLSLLFNSVRSVEAACKEVEIPFEIIITDFNSNDTDYGWLTQEQKLSLIRANITNYAHESDTSFSRGYGLNLAAKGSQYDNLLLMDADAVINAEFIRNCVVAISHDKIYFPIWWHLSEDDVGKEKEFLGTADVTSDIEYKSDREKPEDTDVEVSGWDALSTGTCCIKKEYWESVHGLPEYSGWGQEDFHFRDALILKGHRDKLVRNKDNGIVHCWHPAFRGFQGLMLNEHIRRAEVNNYVKLNGWDKFK